MFVQLLAAALLLISGTLAGVLVAVEVAVVPMLAGLPGDRYVQVHRLLDPRFDPLMPTLNKIGLGCGLLLVVLAPGVGAKAVLGLAEAGLVGVALVSELTNVRINRAIDGWDPGRLPEGWAAVRTRWARANRGRTWISVAGFAAAAGGMLLLSR
ncbi:anthrone oxygenase family protein [Streptomyces sp. XY431]|uniref:anthrone oxygenase family protein n=1 Tax=Streptomyces sp. XY431 TaxID=1415562 RepID=UPI0006AFA53B|nr:anthrone oxygenase family protein [Streptomyces sp. XY431]